MRYTMPIKVYQRVDSYTAGEDAEETWEGVTEDDGRDTYYCSWAGTYGAAKVSTMNAGIMDSATITMPYAPNLFKALDEKPVIIAKAAAEIVKDGVVDPTSPDAYVLYTGVENINETNRKLRFVVRRYRDR